MSNTVRKLRKKNGEKFVRKAKVGTPLEDLAIPVVTDRNGRVTGAVVSHRSNRFLVKLAKRIKDRDAA